MKTKIRNPKLEGSNVYDCKPQTGLCPLDCNQCFYNRPGAFYTDIDKPHMPNVKELEENDIVRVNSGHDSNIDKELVIEKTKKYNNKFFNTSIPKFDFPGPVVFTANREEEKPSYFFKNNNIPKNLMFVRLRVSNTNLKHIDEAVEYWVSKKIPVVLTFMAYYTYKPIDNGIELGLNNPECYSYKKRVVHSYYCATSEFIKYVLKREKKIGERLVTICGTIDDFKCKICRICESYYWQTVKNMKEEF